MFGAILGDIVGSPYEYGLSGKTKEFPLFVPQSGFTDDTVMTIAVADGLMRAGIDADDDTIRENIVDATCTVIKSALSLLGIEVVESM